MNATRYGLPSYGCGGTTTVVIQPEKAIVSDLDRRRAALVYGLPSLHLIKVRSASAAGAFLSLIEQPRTMLPFQRPSRMMTTEPETYHFADDGRFPNSQLPLLVYRDALPPDPAAMARAFATNGWSNAWRDGILAFHHFHSIAHEVLGIAKGNVEIMFGGHSGQTVSVRAGDVVVIPAGIGHRNMGQTDDLVVIGAYPGGADYDTLRGNPAEHAAALRRIAALPVPKCDPVTGPDGSLRTHWIGTE